MPRTAIAVLIILVGLLATMTGTRAQDASPAAEPLVTDGCDVPGRDEAEIVPLNATASAGVATPVAVAPAELPGWRPGRCRDLERARRYPLPGDRLLEGGQPAESAGALFATTMSPRSRWRRSRCRSSRATGSRPAGRGRDSGRGGRGAGRGGRGGAASGRFDRGRGLGRRCGRLVLDRDLRAGARPLGHRCGSAGVAGGAGRRRPPFPVQAAVAAAAAEQGVDPGAVTVVSYEPKEWGDASLGCPKQGEVYAQVITPGFLVVLSVNGEQSEYHTDSVDRAVNCTA